MATLNEPSPQGTSSGSGLRCQDTILGGAEVQTRFETASKQSNEPSLLRANTLGSGEDRLKLNKLMELCTKLFARVLDLETTKTAQAKEIANLKKRVKKLERKKKSRIPRMNLFKIGDFDEEFDANMDEAFEQVYEVDKDVEGDAEQVISAATDEVPTDIDVNTASAPVTTAGVSVSIVEPVTTVSASVTTVGVTDTTVEPSTPPTTTTTIFKDEDLTIAHTLMKIKSEKSKGKMVEQEKPLKKKDQIKFDEELAQKLQAQMQAELEEEERMAKL
ncbi:hypothetical protein Tco_0695480, partial [Tanacetum coccineum]